jgi:hypothetical protein
MSELDDDCLEATPRSSRAQAQQLCFIQFDFDELSLQRATSNGKYRAFVTCLWHRNVYFIKIILVSVYSAIDAMSMLIANTCGK